MDDAEQAEHLIRSKLRGIIEQRRLRDGPLFAGVCLACGRILAHPQRWCDERCARQWRDTERT